MDWTTFTLIIPIARWAKKQFDIARREKHVSAREQDVARREKQLEELIELRNHNIEKLPDFIFLEVSSVNYGLGDVTKIAEIQFSITNRSIFDVILHKFTARPLYEGRKLANIQDVEERKITKQADTSFMVTYNLQESTAKKLEELQQTKGRAYWQFEMHGYFRSEVREFDKEQSGSLMTHP